MNRQELNQLKELRRALSFESTENRADFGDERVTHHSSFGRGARELTVHQLVVEQTQLWRQTWILPVFDQLIEKYEKQLEARDTRRRKR